MVSPRQPARSPKSGLDPQALFALRDLELRARVVVEGLWAGLHPSPFTGFSVEFTEYRQYSPGDDLRYLDWRALARTDRHYLKKYQEETNLRCQLLVDASRSMQFGSRGVTKADYARTLAATIAYFLLQQRDQVGATLFADKLTGVVPARWRPGQLRHLLALLDRPQETRETRLDRALEQVAPLWRKRSLVIILSDFLSPAIEWDQALGRLVAAGHDVRAVQVLDPAELTLEFGRTALWQDLEGGPRLYIDPAQARAGYVERISAHQLAVKDALQRRGIRHVLATTDRPLDFVVLELLRDARRASGRRRRR
jgi:uncharacterized protein (DUF58 family)